MHIDMRCIVSHFVGHPVKAYNATRRIINGKVSKLNYTVTVTKYFLTALFCARDSP